MAMRISDNISQGNDKGDDVDGGSGLIGGIVQGLAGPVEQNAANAFNFQMAADSRDYNTQMADTQHQREVADLKAAGLNPILSAGGSGTSVPSSPTPQMTPPPVNMPDFMTYGISLKNLDLAQKRLDVDTGVAKAQVAKTLSDVDVNQGVKKLQKMGLIGRELGTDPIDSLKQGFQNMIKNVKQPPSPSGGGDFLNNQPKDNMQWDNPMLSPP